MKRALWGFTLIVDALAVVAASSFLMLEAPLSTMAWGAVMIAVFGALLALLVKPQLLGRHALRAVAVLSLAIPAVMVLGSLDLGRISGQEVYAILIGGLVGWLNWSAFRRQHGDVAPTAAYPPVVGRRVPRGKTGTLSVALMVPLIYKIELVGSGWVAIMARPRAGEWAQDEFAGLSRLGVTDVVSLLELSEAQELGLSDESQLCSAASITFHSFPIADRGVPTSAAALSQLACRLYHSSAGGRRITIHCRAGIGRSSLVAAAVLLHCGHTPEEAFSQISRVRGLPVPDTVQQADWLAANQSIVARCDLPRTGFGHG